MGGGYYPQTGGYYPQTGGGYYPQTGGYYPQTGGYYPQTGGYYPQTGGYYPGGIGGMYPNNQHITTGSQTSSSHTSSSQMTDVHPHYPNQYYPHTGMGHMGGMYNQYPGGYRSAEKPTEVKIDGKCYHSFLINQLIMFTNIKSISKWLYIFILQKPKPKNTALKLRTTPLTNSTYKPTGLNFSRELNSKLY